MTTSHHEKQSISGVTVSLQELIALQVQARELLLPLTMKLKNNWIGDHVSARRGRGMDFEEVRVYCPGDDVRTMDWRVTARTNTPHVKVYREERERPVFLVVDFSPTMFFGTRVAFKSVIAAKAAALLVWATVLSGDRIGAILFSGEQEFDQKPTSRINGVLPILNALTNLTVFSENTQSNITMEKVLGRIRRVAPSGSSIFILSDFDHFDEKIQRQIHHLSLRHRLITGFIYDPFESELPDVGVCQLTNGIDKLLLNTTSRDTLHRYKEQFYRRMNLVRETVTQSGQVFFQLATNQSILSVLQEVLRRTGEIRR